MLALALLCAVSVASALIAVNNTSTIQASWETFELGRSEKARALAGLNVLERVADAANSSSDGVISKPRNLAMLRKSLGYGGKIYQVQELYPAPGYDQTNNHPRAFGHSPRRLGAL